MNSKASEDRYKEVTTLLGDSVWSSHPIHYKRRRWLYVVFGLLPLGFTLLGTLVLVITWGLIRWQDPIDAIKLIINAIFWVIKLSPYLTALAMFAIGFGVTGLLVVLASRYQTLHQKDRLTKHGQWPWWVVLAASLLFGIIGVVYIASKNEPLSFLAQFILVGPILLILLLLGPILDLVNGQQLHRGRPLKTWIFRILLLAGLTVVVTSFFKWGIGQLEVLATNIIELTIPLTEDTTKTVWQHGSENEVLKEVFGDTAEKWKSNIVRLFQALLIIFNASLFVTWLLWKQPEEKEEDKKKEKKEEPGFIGRVIGTVASAFGVGVEEKSSGTPREWLDPLLELEELPDGCSSINRISDDIRGATQEDLDIAPTSTDLRYHTFFGDITPTVDQHEAIDKFVTSRISDVRLLDDPGDEPCGDMMIPGMEGSGRATLIGAMSLACALLHGNHVLILCADLDSANRMQKRVQEMFTISGASYLLSIERLSSLSLRESLDANSLAEMPAILIATPSEFERVFFSGEVEINKARKAAVKMLDSVLVDNIMELQSTDRINLPFLLGKIRLANEVARDIVQVAVVVPDRMEKEVQDSIGDRLFSPIRKWGRQLLRPWRRPPDVELDIVVHDMDVAIDSLTGFILNKGQGVVLLRRSMDESQRRQEQLRLLPEGVDPKLLRVVSSLHELEDEEEVDEESPESADQVDSDWCIIMKRMSTDDQVGVSIPHNCPGQKTAVLHLRAPNVPPPYGKTGSPAVIPVLGSSRSEGMLARELESVVGYLPLQTTAHRNIWRQFGIPGVNHIMGIGEDEHAKRDFTFRVDPAENSAEYVGQHQGRRIRGPYPWMQLETYNNDGQAIGQIEEQNSLRALRIVNQTEIVIGVRPLEETEIRRIANWSAGGQHFDQNRFDLAKVVNLRAFAGGRPYVPKSIIVDPNGRTVIDGIRSNGNFDETTMPIWFGAVTIPEKSRPRMAAYGFLPYLCWHNLCKSDNQLLPEYSKIEWSLRGMFAESGKMEHCNDIDFSYVSVSSLLFLGDVQGLVDPPSWLHATWSSEEDPEGIREFWPELTAALMAALARCAPDSAELGRIMAFRHPDNPGAACVLILEPPDTAGTLEEVFCLILRMEKFRVDFFKYAQDVLDYAATQCAGITGPSDLIFSALAVPAQQAYQSFNTMLDLPAAQSLLRSLSEEDTRPTVKGPMTWVDLD